MKIAGLFFLSLGAVLLVVQRVFTAGAPVWVDVTLLVLAGLCVLVALALAKGVGSSSKEPEETGTKKESGSD
jgi:membrane protein implicated in regulation of membrane protease activity